MNTTQSNTDNIKEPKKGIRNYDVKYIEYLKDKYLFIVLNDGTQILVEVISILPKKGEE